MNFHKNKNYIYKFSSISNFTFQNLLLKEIRFNPISIMNDQLEGIIKISNIDFSPKTQAINNFIKKHKLYKPAVLNYIKENSFAEFYAFHLFNFNLGNFGLTCFSEASDEPLMWAHYANNHQGICFVYDRELLLKNLKASNSTIEYYKMKYGTKPTLTLIENNGNIYHSSDLPILTTKDLNWKYEKEIRFIFENDNEFKGQSYLTGAIPLKAIIYGSKA